MIGPNSIRLHHHLVCIAVVLLGAGLVPATAAVAVPAYAAAAPTPAAAIAAVTGLFTPLPTARVFDGTASTNARQVQIAGLGGVPADATAVLVNTEVFAPTAAGYVRVTPAGLDASVAVQEYAKGQAISNLVAVKLVNGRIQVKVSAGTARILMDIAGYYGTTTGAPFTPLPTARVFDGTASTTARQVQIAGLGGVPADATAVLVNTEVFAPTAAGYVRVTPAGQDPSVATQEYTQGQAISNLVAVKLVSGKIQVKVSAGTARILMDIAGYYQTNTGSPFTPLPTARIFTGTATTTPMQVQIAGLGGVPADATAVLINTEVFAPTAPGYMRVTPAGQDPSVATQEYTQGQAISNLVAVKLVSGKIQVKVSAGTARILMDIAGYFGAMGLDTAPPGPPTELVAVATSATSIFVAWTNPIDIDLAGVRICRGTGPAPPPSGCTPIATVSAPDNSYLDNGVLPGTAYRYALFSFDTSGNLAIDPDTNAATPPAGVASISGTVRDQGGKPIANVVVDVFTAAGKLDTTSVGTAGANGTYTVAGLDAGSYFVCFRTASERSHYGYRNQCYTDQAWDGKTAPSGPRDTLVTVTAGGTHGGINATLCKRRNHHNAVESDAGRDGRHG